MKFTKMQGIGNDYVYVNCFQEQIENPSEVSRRISDRHFGIGSDGLILIKPSERAENTCMITVLQIKRKFLWTQRAVLSIWI